MYAFVMDYYSSCRLCPRMCGADRNAGQLGYCRAGVKPKLACSVLHRGEEPPISGARGSGALFFSSCTLGCGFCQNHQLSREGYGVEITVEELAFRMVELQLAGAESLNLITAGQYAPSVVEALTLARSGRLSEPLSLPVVWNSSGFDSPELLLLIRPHVDIFLPDLKTLSPSTAEAYFSAPAYPDAVRKALLSMVDSHPLEYRRGQLVRGVIVRHLLMPGAFSDTEEVLRWFAKELKGAALLSLMVQFVDPRDPSADYRLAEGEYAALIGLLDELGIEEGFIQEEERSSGGEAEWLPDFRRYNPFPSDFAETVWHC